MSGRPAGTPMRSFGTSAWIFSGSHPGAQGDHACPRPGRGSLANSISMSAKALRGVHRVDRQRVVRGERLGDRWPARSAKAAILTLGVDETSRRGGGIVVEGQVDVDVHRGDRARIQHVVWRLRCAPRTSSSPCQGANSPLTRFLVKSMVASCRTSRSSRARRQPPPRWIRSRARLLGELAVPGSAAGLAAPGRLAPEGQLPPQGARGARLVKLSDERRHDHRAGAAGVGGVVRRIDS